jgi:hypothetical protein
MKILFSKAEKSLRCTKNLNNSFLLVHLLDIFALNFYDIEKQIPPKSMTIFDPIQPLSDFKNLFMY